MRKIFVSGLSIFLFSIFSDFTLAKQCPTLAEYLDALASQEPYLRKGSDLNKSLAFWAEGGGDGMEHLYSIDTNLAIRAQRIATDASTFSEKLNAYRVLDYTFIIAYMGHPLADGMDYFIPLDVSKTVLEGLLNPSEKSAKDIVQLLVRLANMPELPTYFNYVSGALTYMPSDIVLKQVHPENLGIPLLETHFTAIRAGHGDQGSFDILLARTKDSYTRFFSDSEEDLRLNLYVLRNNYLNLKKLKLEHWRKFLIQAIDAFIASPSENLAKDIGQAADILAAFAAQSGDVESLKYVLTFLGTHKPLDFRKGEHSLVDTHVYGSFVRALGRDLPWDPATRELVKTMAKNPDKYGSAISNGAQYAEKNLMTDSHFLY